MIQTLPELQNKVTVLFQPKKGLRQGCSLLLRLFRICLVRALVNSKQKYRNMRLRAREKPTTLVFAVDHIVIAEDKENLNFMVGTLYKKYQTAVLTMNIGKCRTNSREELKI